MDNGEGTADPEAADLANKKKAANLALKRLKDQLERGESPGELMEDLGYTEQDLQQFMQRLEERLADPGLDQSAESESARRQFDSLLKGIDLNSEGALKEGGKRKRNAASGFGSKSRPVPPEYRKSSEAYRKRLSREGTAKP